MTARKYTTALSKGQGLIPETVSLLQIWEPGMTSLQLVSSALDTGALSKATAHRVRGIITEGFASRYLVDSPAPALYLKSLLAGGVSIKNLSQLFFVYTARANLILHDFVREVYWAKYSAGGTQLDKEDALHFIESGNNRGFIPRPWSTGMRDRVAGYLLGCLHDFALLSSARRGRREIVPFNIASLTTLYFSHELHFRGLSDSAVLEHSDWGLFGLDYRDVVRELERVSYGGHFVVQYSGEILRIAWKYKTMEECLDAIAASEL
jgi:hypothetical protein